MGAPERKEQLAVVPLREIESATRTVSSFSVGPGPRGFSRVPTYAIGVPQERRHHPRAWLSLPLRLMRIDDTPEPVPVTLVTRNISSSGIYFLAPRKMQIGTAIELEVALIDRPTGFGRVQMCTAAHIVRSEEAFTPGWHGYAASFDDFALKRDDVLPLRYIR